MILENDSSRYFCRGYKNSFYLFDCFDINNIGVMIGLTNLLFAQETIDILDRT